jgi:sugar phosphate isomerase/epimerase
MKLGANSVLFGAFDMETAFKYTAMAGYDGIELSAIDGMSEHLVLDRWQELAPEIVRLSKAYGLELLAMEQPSQDPVRMETAFQAAVEIGVPIVNCGPRGKADDEEAWVQVIDSLGSLAQMAERYGVTLCVKAHVGASIYNTPTTLLARTRSRPSPPSSRGSNTCTSATARAASTGRGIRWIRPTGAATLTCWGTSVPCTSTATPGRSTWR